MKAFAKVGATLVATSLLFGPVYVSARNGQLTAGDSADGTTGNGQLWDSGLGREARDSHGAIDEGRSNGVEGETKRRSKLSRRASTSFLSRQPGALQKLLAGALVSMGMLSAVRLGKEFMRGPSGSDEEAVRGGPSAAGLSSRSLPNGLLVGALTLLVIASTLATPLLPQHSRRADENATQSDGFSFFYKGKHCEVKFDAKERRRYGITNEDLRTASKALSSPPKEIKFTEEGGGTKYFWGLTRDPERNPGLLNFFSLADGRQYWMELPHSIVHCISCRDKIRALAEEVKKYELLLTSWKLEKSWRERPRTEVQYEWKDGRTICRVGGPEREGAVATFSIGNTDFKIVLPTQVTDALTGKAGNETFVGAVDPNQELLAELLRGLSNEPEMKLVRKDPMESLRREQGPVVKLREYNPDAIVRWGSGPYSQPFPEELVNYEVSLPQLLPLVLDKTNNSAWWHMKDLLQAASQPIQLAILREQMTSN